MSFSKIAGIIGLGSLGYLVYRHYYHQFSETINLKYKWNFKNLDGLNTFKIQDVYDNIYSVESIDDQLFHTLKNDQSYNIKGYGFRIFGSLPRIIEITEKSKKNFLFSGF